MNITSSETCKLMENSYRAVNIAFIDEWQKFSNQLNLDLFDIINAIKKRETHNIDIDIKCISKTIYKITKVLVKQKTNISINIDNKKGIINKQRYKNS